MFFNNERFSVMKRINTMVLLILFFFISNITMGQPTKLKITINGQKELSATLVDNTSTAALIDLIKAKPLTIAMRDYGNMEKVGSIGTTLPRNDEQITTEPGELILYQGSAFVIYYAPNSWNFTRLGKIDNVTQDELKTILGAGDVSITLELADTATHTGLLETNNNPFRVYPNPVKEYFEIEGDLKSVTLFDRNGVQILSSIKNRVNIGSFPQGIYLLKIETKNGEAIFQKLLKS